MGKWFEIVVRLGSNDVIIGGRGSGVLSRRWRCDICSGASGLLIC